MAYRIQVFYPHAGFFFNTNHESEDLDELKSLVASSLFDGFRCRIVDGAGDEVPFDRGPGEKDAALTIEDIARALKVPVVQRFEDLDMPGWTDPEDRSS